MSDQMTIEQAAEYLREKLPGREFYLFAHMHTESLQPQCVVKTAANAQEQEWVSDEGFSAPVRAAVDWARGQEVANA